MWAGTSWMPKYHAVIWASMVSTAWSTRLLTSSESAFELMFSTESQVLNGSNFGPWDGPIYFENVMCNGTEPVGVPCITPGIGVVTNPECFNPYRTAAVRCYLSELELRD